MLIIGISGGSGSGKTTLAKRISSKMNVCYLPMDSYYKDQSHLSEEEKLRYNFDHPDSMDFELLVGHMRKLKLDIPIERPVYSYLTSSRSPETLYIPAQEIIILDGLLAFTHQLLVNEIGLKIYLDVNENNRLKRLIKRDMQERGRTRQAVIDRFYEVVKPMHEMFIEPNKRISDLLVDGNSEDLDSIALNMETAIARYINVSHAKIM